MHEEMVVMVTQAEAGVRAVLEELIAAQNAGDAKGMQAVAVSVTVKATVKLSEANIRICRTGRHRTAKTRKLRSVTSCQLPPKIHPAAAAWAMSFSVMMPIGWPVYTGRTMRALAPRAS